MNSVRSQLLLGNPETSLIQVEFVRNDLASVFMDLFDDGKPVKAREFEFGIRGAYQVYYGISDRDRPLCDDAVRELFLPASIFEGEPV
jgi:hypothetical protein